MRFDVTAPLLQETVIGGAAAKAAIGAGLIVITRDCVIVLLHASVNVQLSVTVPPHAPGGALNVDVTLPLIRHTPLPPFV